MSPAPHYRYLVATADIPAEHIQAGDLVEIPIGTHEPIGSYRKHGHNHGRFLGYEADGLLTLVDGVIGFPHPGVHPDLQTGGGQTAGQGPRLA